ncbi:MAG: hypothetical protein ACRDR6_02945 [Pseudonocardiaceae bacterium]
MPATPDKHGILARIRGFYGENPLHLLALLGCFALAGYVALRLRADPTWPTIALWFFGAVIGHDLVLFPLYALADRSLSAGLHALRLGQRPRATTPRVPAVNHLRVPILGTALTFLLFFPGIIHQGQQTYHDATGQTQAPYLDRWLLLTTAMFTISAIIYAARLAHAHQSPGRASSSEQDGGPGIQQPESGPAASDALPGSSTGKTDDESILRARRPSA